MPTPDSDAGPDETREWLDALAKQETIARNVVADRALRHRRRRSTAVGALMRRIHLFAALAFAPLLVSSTMAHAQVYRCNDANGRTTYSDAPCAHGGQTMKLPESSSRGFGDTTVCGQLLDETRRLAAEERRAKRNGAKHADTSKRRRALTAQYERRCASVRRSGR